MSAPPQRLRVSLASLLAWVGAASTLALTWPALAHAEPTLDPATLRRAEAMATEAKIFFKQGQFGDASERYMEAFNLVGKPALLFNAARAREEEKNPTKALALFKYYVSLPAVPEDGKIDADARIRRLEEEVRKAAPPIVVPLPPKPDGPPPPPKTEAPKIEPPKGTPVRIGPPQPVPPQDGPPPRLRLWTRFHTWTFATSGVLVGLGGGTYLLAVRESGRAAEVFATLQTPDDKTRYLAHAADARAWQRVAIGASAVGVGLAAWAAVDWWQGVGVQGVEPAPGALGPTVRVWFAPDPHGAAVMASFAF